METKRTTIKLDKDLHLWLKKFCLHNERSMSSVIGRLLEGMRKEEDEKKVSIA